LPLLAGEAMGRQLACRCRAEPHELEAALQEWRGCAAGDRRAGLPCAQELAKNGRLRAHRHRVELDPRPEASDQQRRHVQPDRDARHTFAVLAGSLHTFLNRQRHVRSPARRILNRIDPERRDETGWR
jgi:hypothetical protein